MHRGRKLKLDDLRQLFARVGFKPALMKDIVKNMSAEGITVVELALQHFIHDDRQINGWAALLDSIPPFARTVLIAIAKGMAPLGQETRKFLSKGRGENAPVTVAMVRAAIVRLWKIGVVGRDQRTRIEDHLLAEYLSTR